MTHFIQGNTSKTHHMVPLRNVLMKMAKLIIFRRIIIQARNWLKVVRY